MAKKLSQIVTEKSKMLLATGQSQTETAEQLGISRKSVNRLAQKHKAEIEQLTLDIISKSIPFIQSIHIETLSLAQEILKSCNNKKKRGQLRVKLSEIGLSPQDILKLSDTKEHRALKIMGIAPANMPSMIFNMLFARIGAEDDSEELGIVQALLESKRNEDIQDAEIVESEDAERE